MKLVAILGVIVIAGLLAVFGFGAGRSPDSGSAAAAVETPAGGEMVAVDMPALAGQALVGQRVFAAKCAECHGPNAGGIEGSGPPLVHKIYEPGHHGDMAIFLAAQNGVSAHHWRFGNMPPVEGITRAEIGAVIDFVRSVQRANGIQ